MVRSLGLTLGLNSMAVRAFAWVLSRRPPARAPQLGGPARRRVNPSVAEIAQQNS